MIKSKILVAAACAVGILSIALVAVLQRSATEGRDSQVKLALVVNDVNALQGQPWDADPAVGGSPARARGEMLATEHRVERTVAALQRENPVAQLDGVIGPWRQEAAVLDRVREMVIAKKQMQAGYLQAKAVVPMNRALAALKASGDAYRARSNRALRTAGIGSGATIILLVAAFIFFHLRMLRARALSERLVEENRRLLEASREEATTDALTGLRNRRALLQDLAERVPQAGTGRTLVLAVFDLDGFKQYNDTFGHAAGDALLTRLGGRLASTVQGIGTAYRMGGDEFCMLADVERDGGDAITRLAASALSEHGDAFRVDCSFGVVVLPDETRGGEEALGIADQRMYEQKASSRASASRQTADVLIRVLGEQSPDLREHITDVGQLAQLTCEHLGLHDHEIRAVGLAGELHDVGKAAIPDAILNKPAPLDDGEWAFMRRHTLIGERIVSAAPSLAHVAHLIRSSHERLDGTGYPDRLSGEEIPVGSRIIAVCDAYDAMTAHRPYRPEPMTTAEALAELRRCAGTQFDPEIVAVFASMIEAGAHVRSTA